MKDVLSLRSVAKNPERNRMDLPAIPMKEQLETLRAVLSYIAQQFIICERFDMLVFGHRLGRNYRLQEKRSTSGIFHIIFA